MSDDNYEHFDDYVLSGAADAEFPAFRNRPILVDELAGTGHRAYGGRPNMTWVVGRGGWAEEFWRDHPPG